MIYDTSIYHTLMEFYCLYIICGRENKIIVFCLFYIRYAREIRAELEKVAHEMKKNRCRPVGI